MVKTRQRRMTVFEFQDGTTQEIVRYIKHNKDLLKAHCLAFHVALSKEVESLLQELQINYFVIRNTNHFKNSSDSKKPEALLDSIISGAKSYSNESSLSRQTSNEALCFNSNLESRSDSINSKAMSFVCTDGRSVESADMEVRSLDSKAKYKTSNNLSLLPYRIFKRPIRSGEDLVLHSHNIFLKGINSGASIKSYGNLEIYGKCEGNLECLGEYIIIRQFTMGRISLGGVNLERKMLDDLKESNEIRMIFIENATIQVIALTEYT